MTQKYFVLGLMFSLTISIVFAVTPQDNQDAFNFVKEVCDATQDGENQDGPCVKKLVKLIMENHHKMSVKAKAENEKALNLYAEHPDWYIDGPLVRDFSDYGKFEEMTYGCTERSQLTGKNFQRICPNVRQGPYTDEVYMKIVSCALGYNKNFDMIEPQITASFRQVFQRCRKLSGQCKRFCKK